MVENTYRVETQWVDYPNDVTLGEITLDPATVIPNQNFTLMVPITNTGYQHMDTVPVTITRDGETVHSDTYTDFYDADGNELPGALLSGASAYLHVTFNVGDYGDTNANRALSYTLNIGGQTQDVRLWYSDFEVFGKQVKIGDKYHIVVRVTNMGYMPAQRTVSLRFGEEAEDVLSFTTDRLSYGDTQYFTFPLDAAPNHNGSLIAYVRVDGDDECMVANNEVRINIDTDQVQLNPVFVKIDRNDPGNPIVTFEGDYTLQSISIQDQELKNNAYWVNGNEIMLFSDTLLKTFANGTYMVQFSFVDQNGVKKYADLELTIYAAGDIKGDVNGDGHVNNKDLGLLQQYVNEWNVTIFHTAADINGDGRVNNFDLGSLQRILNA